MATVHEAREVSSSVSIDDKIHRTYTSKYQAIADLKASPLQVAGMDPIPEYGHSYNWFGWVDVWAFVTSINAVPVSLDIDWKGEQAMKWEVTVTHSSKPTEGNQERKDNPLLDPPVISGSFSRFRSPRSVDAYGMSVINSARQSYQPAIEIDDAEDTLDISYNTATINLAFRVGFKGTVNSVPMWGMPKRCVKLDSWKWTIMAAGNGMKYIKNDFQFKINYRLGPDAAHTFRGVPNARGWYTVLPNTGYGYYEKGGITAANGTTSPNLAQDAPPAETRWKAFKVSGSPVTTPQQLDRWGDEVPVDEDALPTEQDFGFNVYAMEPEANFLTIPRMPALLPGPFTV